MAARLVLSSDSFLICFFLFDSYPHGWQNRDLMKRFENKVAVVAGGATGIGADTSRRLASEGACVVVGDLNFDGAGATTKTIVDGGGTAVAVHFDLGDEASVAALMQTAVDIYGGLDVLHCNGADTSKGTDVDTNAVEVPIELWDHLIRVNLRGYLFCLRYAIPHMLRRGGGAIVCTTSDGVFLGRPHGVANYAAKAGVMSLVRHVATRWGKEGIRCNSVSPGMIESEAARQGMKPDAVEYFHSVVRGPRVGQPADIAAAVAYFLSDDAEYVTGQCLSVNGGIILR
jgi:NAD(P)-dependent dehydrogenase (short-subunit alcohol dehydrogenase family)